jgi:hypothetical protein
MSRSPARPLARAAVVTAAVLVGISSAQAGQDFAFEAPDLVVSGGIVGFSLGELNAAGVTADVANIRGGPSAATSRSEVRTI